MSNPGQVTVTMRIMDHEYQVACPENERDALVASANYLNERMAAIRRRGKALGVERIAVMTSLNMARELLSIRDGQSADIDDEISDRLRKLQSKIDAALQEN